MSARDNILARLRGHAVPVSPEQGDFGVVERQQWTPRQRIERLRERMESVHTEVHCVPRGGWALQLLAIVRDKGLGNLLYAPQTDHGRAIEATWAQAEGTVSQLLRGEWQGDEWKQRLFGEVEAAVTATRGAIADTGSLVLWPDRHEPRMMSLVPPVHFAILDGARIHDTFLSLLREEQWFEQGMPTNALLISGPSKTADIEQTLAYGVHGPKELVVLLLDDGA